MNLREGVTGVAREEHPAVVEVWEASVRATHHFLNESDIGFFKKLIGHGLLDKVRLDCVRDDTGRIVGFLGTSDTRIEMLFVDPAWHGKGVGRRLVQHARETYGADALDVNEQNPGAVAFYLKLGFEVQGRSAMDGMGKPYPLLHMRLPLDA